MAQGNRITRVNQGGIGRKRRKFYPYEREWHDYHYKSTSKTSNLRMVFLRITFYDGRIPSYLFGCSCLFPLASKVLIQLIYACV